MCEPCNMFWNSAAMRYWQTVCCAAPVNVWAPTTPRTGDIRVKVRGNGTFHVKVTPVGVNWGFHMHRAPSGLGVNTNQVHIV